MAFHTLFSIRLTNGTVRIHHDALYFDCLNKKADLVFNLLVNTCIFFLQIAACKRNCLYTCVSKYHDLQTYQIKAMSYTSNGIKTLSKITSETMHTGWPWWRKGHIPKIRKFVSSNKKNEVKYRLRTDQWKTDRHPHRQA